MGFRLTKALEDGNFTVPRAVLMYVTRCYEIHFYRISPDYQIPPFPSNVTTTTVASTYSL